VFNDYRGASSVHGYPLPVPYFIYRGDILQADRDGVHGRLLNQRYLEFDISANATAPVFSQQRVRAPACRIWIRRSSSAPRCSGICGAAR
jgi:hypothetical protein